MKNIFMNGDQSLASEDIADFDFLVAGIDGSTEHCEVSILPEVGDSICFCLRVSATN